VTLSADREEFPLDGEPDALIFHAGAILAGLWDSASAFSMIVHLSGSANLSPDPDAKGIVEAVEAAVKIVADAVSIHVNLGSATEAEVAARPWKDIQPVSRVNSLETRGDGFFKPSLTA
jgi:DhnA family fructose-bisphosphate aldolase class Ia